MYSRQSYRSFRQRGSQQTTRSSQIQMLTMLTNWEMRKQMKLNWGPMKRLIRTGKQRTLHSPIDSRWTPLDSTCPSGVQVECRWICFGREPCQILAKIHLDSRWSPIGLQMDHMDYMDPTSHHPTISAPPGFWWTPHGLHLIFGWFINNFLFWEIYIQSHII